MNKSGKTINNTFGIQIMYVCTIKLVPLPLPKLFCFLNQCLSST